MNEFARHLLQRHRLYALILRLRHLLFLHDYDWFCHSVAAASGFRSLNESYASVVPVLRWRLPTTSTWAIGSDGRVVIFVYPYSVDQDDCMSARCGADHVSSDHELVKSSGRSFFSLAIARALSLILSGRSTSISARGSDIPLGPIKTDLHEPSAQSSLTTGCRFLHFKASRENRYFFLQVGHRKYSTIFATTAPPSQRKRYDRGCRAIPCATPSLSCRSTYQASAHRQAERAIHTRRAARYCRCGS